MGGASSGAGEACSGRWTPVGAQLLKQRLAPAACGWVEDGMCGRPAARGSNPAGGDRRLPSPPRRPFTVTASVLKSVPLLIGTAAV